MLAAHKPCPCASGQDYSACCGQWHAGVVEFVARCREGGSAQRLHETSRFVRQFERWYYIDGTMVTPD